jgi:hypothetical protein
VGDLKPIWADAPRREPDLPLPPYRFLPGHNERPGEGHVQFENAFNAGVDLYHLGYLWEAHEAWEAKFHAVSGAERELVQGLIQLAAAMIKVHIGNEAGVQKLYAKSRGHLAVASTRDIDLARLREDMNAYFESTDRDWLAAPRICPQFVAGAG